MNEIKEHAILFSEKSALKLGLAHSYIAIADKQLENLQYKKEEKAAGKFVLAPMLLTPFGEATISNFMKWWLSNHIDKIDELRRRLEALLPLLVKLKRNSAKVEETFDGTEYETLIIRLARFANEHKSEIEAFYNLIAWLHQINKLAPCMFFTHPPWSTSQLSDRVMYGVNDPPKEDEVGKAAEIVFGLRRGYEPTLYRIRSDMEAEIADTSDPERMQTLMPSSSGLFRRVSRKVLAEFALYFEKMRICGERICSEIDSLLKGEILKNEQFLKLFIQKAKQEQRMETGLWDFKKTISAWHRRTETILGVNFAVDVASFANERGGLITIGIDNDRKVVGVPNAERRISQTRSLLNYHLRTYSDSIELLSLPFENELGEKVTILIVIIPQTKKVVGVKNVNRSFFYPRREDVGVKYSSREEILQSKKDVFKDNFLFARDVFEFVFQGCLIGR